MDSYVELDVKTVGDVADSVVVSSCVNGVELPEDVSFDLYKHKDAYLVHGESENLEYKGESIGDDQTYYVGVFDPQKKTVELLRAPLLSTRVTSKRKLSIPKIRQLDVQRNVQRNALGEAFGTKKAKKAILDLEKNKIDASKLETEQSDIIDSIKVNTSMLPSKSEMLDDLNEHRVIPQFDVDATSVDDIYPLENIISKRELASIRVDSLQNDSIKAKDKLDLLPYSNSRYLLRKLSSISKDTPDRKLKLQMLYYVSLLMGLYANRRVHAKDQLLESLNQPPVVLVDYVLKNFSILKKNNRNYLIDPKCEDKILCYLLALILKLDEYQVEVSPLAQELSLKPSRLTSLFRSLGCVIKNATAAQCEAFGVPKTAANNYKIATLRVPFKAPELARRGGARR
ncbi:hypothetical protein KL921_005181 [Ogataea angusta]|uniref:Uncharacterized protein n=1 Tax=Pichia angusta TaxID=870730 RepID=A0AAN6DEL6_PICAN|nr:uncharacterized protein KL928_004682 [Ogataea angusta]KAG7805868.1 hypothetical protein KL921_005181 [Ogataea angusta]KAG7816640.1 hypothetical protein KL928_004682 [Ogataea angusta]